LRHTQNGCYSIRLNKQKIVKTISRKLVRHASNGRNKKRIIRLLLVVARGANPAQLLNITRPSGPFITPNLLAFGFEQLLIQTNPGQGIASFLISMRFGQIAALIYSLLASAPIPDFLFGRQSETIWNFPR